MNLRGNRKFFITVFTLILFTLISLIVRGEYVAIGTGLALIVAPFIAGNVMAGRNADKNS